ncbi:HDOD domain-containing protein [Marinobacterium alkalitolerans]|nr:HDOD domain-containing protein [Marinobacterium alkalitolerans]
MSEDRVEGTSRPEVLVVDDEAAVLSSARRLIRRSHPNWTVLMAESVSEALSLLEDHSPRVLIADKLMPGPGGIDLLEHVRISHPRILRVMLTGDTSRAALLEVAGLAHLIFAKPFDPGAIASILDRATCIHHLPVNNEIKTAIGSLRQLPVVSHTFSQLSVELARDEVSLDRIVDLVEMDQALTARLLQLANSAFFGFSSETASIRDAVVRLGSELIRAIVLALELFHPASNARSDGAHACSFSIARQVAERALVLGRALELDRHDRDAVFVAGILHNIGALITLELSSSACANDEISAVGAYLLTLWGFNTQYAQLVLDMRKPGQACERDRALAALHVAWVQETEGDDSELLDHAFLASVGITIGSDGNLILE